MGAGIIMSQIVSHLAPQVPLLGMYVIGGFLAIVFWHRSPRSALLVLVACLLCLFDSIAFAGLYAAIPRVLKAESVGGPGSLRLIYMGFGVVAALIKAVAWGLMLAAVFSKRNETMPVDPYLHQAP